MPPQGGWEKKFVHHIPQCATWINSHRGEERGGLVCGQLPCTFHRRGGTHYSKKRVVLRAWCPFVLCTHYIGRRCVSMEMQNCRNHLQASGGSESTGGFHARPTNVFCPILGIHGRPLLRMSAKNAMASWARKDSHKPLQAVSMKFSSSVSTE